MRYDYGCDKCKIKVEQIHKMSESPSYQCPECSGPMVRLFTPTLFHVKGGTPATHWKEKRNRMKKREEVAAVQERKGPGPRVQPNIAGYELDSWSDAQKLAKEAGMAHESYTPWVEREKKTKIAVPSSLITK